MFSQIINAVVFYCIKYDNMQYDSITQKYDHSYFLIYACFFIDMCVKDTCSICII